MPDHSFAELALKTGLTPKAISKLLGYSEREIHRWIKGEFSPRKAAVTALELMVGDSPFSPEKKGTENFRFIDLFAGIGGIRLPFEELGGKCVFSSEWDKYAQRTYAANFKDVPDGDITKIASSEIPAHDLLVAGFPCQAFSNAGHKQGFMDTRGTMFFEIQRILSYHRPKAFLLENVKQLKGHDKGNTLRTILEILEGRNKAVIPDTVPMSAEARASLKTKLNYQVWYKVLKATDYGVPQNRERIFIIGLNKDYFPDLTAENGFSWPAPTHTETSLGDILIDNALVDKKYTISDRLWQGHQRRKKEHAEKGNGFGYSLFDKKSSYANTISARYYKDGSEILIDQSDLGHNPRKLTPRECARLQGFPDEYFIDCVSDAQAYRQFGNSVSIPVIRAIATNLLECMSRAQKGHEAA